jgi:LmbE family N-acetylglucosaminyl deacetylase
MLHLFLSPHPDDTALSCGGTIYHLRQAENQQCVILTVMSGDPPANLPDTPHVRELHQRWQAGEDPMATRRSEDEQAATVLSAKTIIHTSLPDCVYRLASDGSALYPGRDDIFGDVHPQDSAYPALLATPLPFGEEVTHVYAPLGAGHHVDHQIIRDWALNLKQQHPDLNLLFYEDYPYSEKPLEVEKALAYYDVPLKLEPRILREIDVMVKLTALQHYESQISTFWGSVAEMDERVRAYMGNAGASVGVQAPVERFWRVDGVSKKESGLHG